MKTRVLNFFRKNGRTMLVTLFIAETIVLLLLPSYIAAKNAQTTSAIADAVNQIKINQDANETKIEADHDRLWACVAELFTDGRQPTKAQAESECHRPVTGETAPMLPVNGRANMQSRGSSSPKSTPKDDNKQTDNSPHSMLRFIPLIDKPIIGCQGTFCI